MDASSYSTSSMGPTGGVNDHVNDAADDASYSFDPSSLTGADDDIPLGLGGEDAAAGEEVKEFRYHPDEPLDLSMAFDGVTPTTTVAEGGETTTAPPPQVWLLKVPMDLRERWAAVEEPGRVLGRLRVYDLLPGQSDADRLFELVVPDEDERPAQDDPLADDSQAAAAEDGGGNNNAAAGPGPSTTEHASKAAVAAASTSKKEAAASETVYELNSGVLGEGQAGAAESRRWVYWERTRKVGFYGKSRFPAHPRLLARASKAAALVPKLTPEQRAKLIRERYNHPTLQKSRIRLLEDENLTKGQLNTITSGAPGTIVKNNLLLRHAQKVAQHNASLNSNNAAASKKAARPLRERTVALPEGPLRDAIAGEFEKYKYWSFRALKERLNQPENHLKRVLSSMAYVEKSGPYRNFWTPRLDLPIFKHQDIGDVGEVAPEEQESLPQFEADGEEEGDEDEDEEMDEVV